MLPLTKIKVKNKAVLIRIDINSSIIKNKIQINDRFIEHAKTIKYLVNKKAKVIILAHQGRKGKKDFVSLKQHAQILSKLTKKKIQYINDLFGKKAINSIKNLKAGNAILLQNVRQFSGETKNLTAEQHKKSKFVKNLSPLVDIFVLDAFSIAHRSHASVVGFTKTLKSYKGPVLEKELKSLKRFKTNIKEKSKFLIYLLAGAKPEENFLLLKHALKQKATILTGGTFCLFCLAAQGKKLGKSEELLKKYKNITKKIKKLKNKNIILPVDFAIEHNKKRKEISLKRLPINKPILDLGKKTIKIYKQKIRKAVIIIVKGPLGKYENKNFALATKEIFKQVAFSKAFSVIGGGNTIDAMTKFKIPKKKFSYISLGGGALLQYLTNNKLAGLVALEN